MLTRDCHPLHSQVIVAEHSLLEALKQDIKSKKGVPTEHQFLSFKSCIINSSSSLRETTWQGIVFRDRQAIGKLCSPAVSLTTVFEDCQAISAVQQCSLAFDTWVPAGTSGASQALRIPVDSVFQEAQLSVQVFGRQETTFVLPHKYSVHGKELASQLQLELQRQSYIQKHQAARSAAGQRTSSGSAALPASTSGPSTVSIETGVEVERLLSVFEVGDRPAWLKSLVCKFLVAEAPRNSSPVAVLRAPHAASPVAGAEEDSGSSSCAAASLLLRHKQPEGHRRQQQRRRKHATGSPVQAAGQQKDMSQAEQSSDSSVLKSEARPCETPSSVDSPSAQRQSKKGKKGMNGKPRMRGKQQDLSSTPAAATTSLPGSVQKAAVREPEAVVTACSPTSQGSQEQHKPRVHHHRAFRERESGSSSAAGRQRKAHQLPPPPGLERRSIEQQKQAHFSSSLQSGKHWGSWVGEGAPGRSDTPGRWKQLGGGFEKGPFQDPASGGSCSDVSSEAITSFSRPSSENSDISSPLDPSAISNSCGSPRHAVDSPASLRVLTEALLPHEGPRSSQQRPILIDGRDAGISVSESSSIREDSSESFSDPPQLDSTVCSEQLISDVVSASTTSSPPSTPRDGARPPSASGSLAGYPSSIDTSARLQHSTSVHSNQGWSPSAQSASSCSQQSYEGYLVPAQVHPNRAHGRGQQPASPPWQSDGSSGRWSAQPSRLGPGAAGTGRNSPVLFDRQPASMHGYAQFVGSSGASNSWQQQEQRCVHSSGQMFTNYVPAAGGGGQLYGPPPPPMHPMLYNPYLLQQQHMPFAHHQHAMLAAMSGQQAIASTMAGNWQCFEPGYQQHLWQPAVPLPVQTQDGYKSGYDTSRSRQHQGMAPRAQQQNVRHRSPASAPVSQCASLTASPVINRKPWAPASPSAPPPSQLSLSMEPMHLQVADSSEDGPDLERFLQAVTPLVVPPGGDAAELSLGDVWHFFEAPSLFGQEVVTLGGPRGPSASYYLPYLSAIQLFVPAKTADSPREQGIEEDAPHHLPCSQGGVQQPHDVHGLYSYPGGLEKWPSHMRLQYQWFAGGHVGERIPLGPQLDQLVGDAGSSHPLRSLKIADLHPYSWFAVAWYPLYRIPEAPLDARFLTYHSLASLWELATKSQALGSTITQDAPASQLPNNLRAAQPALSASTVRAAADGCCHLPSPFAVNAGSGGGVAARVAHALQAGLLPGVTTSSTPTGVCSFPGSPTCSDSGTRTTNGGQLRSDFDSSGSARSLDAGSLTPSPSPAVSELGDGECVCALSLSAHSAERVPVPVAGLQWYTMPRSVENWTETLVAAQLPEDVAPVGGTVLADGSRILGCWRGVAVVAKPYPASKGGSMAWEVQLEELAETASRLATGRGLLFVAPNGAMSHAPSRRCPDHDFFSSRAWTCKSSAAAAGARCGHSAYA